jgi:hypothetical protein
VNIVNLPRRRSLIVVLVLLSCLLLGGRVLDASLRGGGSHPAAPRVTVALVAPMTGATVGVSQIDVSGTVTPATATVHVGGVTTAVRGGSFSRPLTLSQVTTTIPVTASASGYAGDRIDVTVHYSPSLAGQLASARTAASDAAQVPLVPISTAARSPTSATPATTLSAGSSGFVPQVKLANQSAAATTGATSTSTSPSPAAPTPAPPTTSPPTTTTPTTTTPTTTTPTTTTPTTTTPTTTPPPSTAPPPLTIAEIKHLYVAGCNHANGGRSAQSYCTCAYRHLARAGLLASRHAIRVLARELAEFNKTGDASRIPRKVLKTLETAQIDCVSDLPTAPLGVRKLPSLHHSGVAAPSKVDIPSG